MALLRCGQVKEGILYLEGKTTSTRIGAKIVTILSSTVNQSRCQAMNETSIVTVRRDYCGEPTKKGDEFVVSRRYPGIVRSWLRARWTATGTLPEDFGEIYHPTCYLESVQNKKKERR